MSDMLPNATVEFSDRKTGLVVFGVAEIIMGLFCALLVPAMLSSLLLQRHAGLQATGATPPPNMGQMVACLLYYVLLAVWFIWMGIGSIQARRWARALMLIFAWGWLICGVTGMAFLVLLMPDMLAQMTQSGQMPRELLTVIKVLMAVFLLLIYIVLPGSLILFYGSRHVKATCEQRDPHVRWTDKCPLQVLGICLMLGCGAVCMPCLGLTNWAIPFFGTILSGATGALVVLTGACLLGYLAWGVYGLRIGAWWGTVGMVLLWGTASQLTFSRFSMLDIYAKMGYEPAQLEAMSRLLTPQFSQAMVLFTVLWEVAVLSYLLFTRKYFAPAAGH